MDEGDHGLAVWNFRVDQQIRYDGISPVALRMRGDVQTLVGWPVQIAERRHFEASRCEMQGLEFEMRRP